MVSYRAGHMRLFGKDLSTASAAAIVLLIPVAVIVASGWICRINRIPSCDGYVPALLAVNVRKLLDGVPLYGDLRNPPYGSLLFGPVVPWMTAPIARLFGPNPIGPLEAGRLLTLLSSVAVGLLIFRLARRSGAESGAAAIAAMAFLLSPALEPWGFEFRVDMPALALELAGLVLFDAGLVWPALAMFVASFFTKQASVAGIAAAVLYLWIAGEQRRSVIMAAAWMAAVIVITLILRSVYPFYMLNNYVALTPLYDVGAPIKMLGSLAIAEFPLIALAGIGALRCWRNRPIGVLFLATALLLDSAATLHWGSNIYYLLPALAATAVVAGSGLAIVLERVAALKLPLQLLAGAALAWTFASQVWLGYRMDQDASWTPPFWVNVNCSCEKAPLLNQQSLTTLSSLDGPVLTNMPELVLTRASRNVEFLDLMALGGMKAHGTFDDTALISAIDHRKFAAIALDWGLLAVQWRGRYLFWPDLARAIAANYQLVSAYGLPPYISVPKVNEK